MIERDDYLQRAIAHHYKMTGVQASESLSECDNGGVEAIVTLRNVNGDLFRYAFDKATDKLRAVPTTTFDVEITSTDERHITFAMWPGVELDAAAVVAGLNDGTIRLNERGTLIRTQSKELVATHVHTDERFTDTKAELLP